MDIDGSQAQPEQVIAFIAVLHQWQVQHRRQVLLSWLGGEPFLWPELEPLTHAAHDAGLRISTTTNGTALNSPRIRRHVLDTYSELTVSIDGFTDFHDNRRGWKGAFSKLKTGVYDLNAELQACASSLTLRANVVLMQDNVRTFGELCHEIASWGIDEICFNQLGGRDRPEFYPAHRLSLDDITWLETELPALRTSLEQQGTRLIGGDDYLRRIRGTTLGEVFPVPECRVADSFLFIDERGYIAPCSFTPDHFARNISEIKTADDLDSLIDDLLTTQKCRPAVDCANCPSTQQFAKWE
ncbi:hypothetical protein AEAC466_19360 [Asticcacaulis sp. AC466]|nr:hypothetical protein AEAC466_19360 [Asticcacaulis sp. AC466]